MSPENGGTATGWRKATARLGAQDCWVGWSLSLRLPVGRQWGGFAQNAPTFHCRCLFFLLPQQDPRLVLLSLSPALCPLSQLSYQAEGRQAAGHMDCGLIFGGLLFPLTVHTQEPPGSDNHLEEACCMCRKSAFKHVGGFQ